MSDGTSNFLITFVSVYITIVDEFIHDSMNTNIVENIQKYFRTQPVVKAWLFGSYSRGEETSESDVDILVQYDRKKLSCRSIYNCWYQTAPSGVVRS